MSALYKRIPARPAWPRICAQLGLWIGLAALLAAGGCGSAAEGAPLNQTQDVARVSIEAFSSWERAPEDATHPLMRFEDPRGTVYSLIGAQLGVASIRFEFSRMRTCAEIDYQAPRFSPNLECAGRWLVLTGPFRSQLRSRNAQTFWRIPALDYRHVEVHVAPVGAAGGASALSSPSSVHARASFEADNAIHELNLDFRFSATLRAAIDAPLRADQALTLRLDVANWLVRIPVSDCLKRGFLGEPGEPSVLDSNFDAPSTAAVFDMTLPQDCADAQARFRSNLRDSLRAQILADAP